MAESTEDKISSTKLFSGLKIWFSQALAQRAWLIEKGVLHGATEVRLEKQADVKIWDHLRKNPPPDVHSYNFILHSIEKGELQDLDEYRVGINSRVDRPVGSIVTASKGSRTRFTQADDQILYDWLTPYRERGGAYRGNEIYKQLEMKYPHHTFQSWRDRYLKKVLHMEMSITDHIDLDSLVRREADEEDDGQPPTKRRRTTDTVPFDPPNSSSTLRNLPLPQRDRLDLNLPTPVINVPSLKSHDSRPMLKVPPEVEEADVSALSKSRPLARVSSFGSENPPNECRATFAELSHQHGFTKSDAAKLYRAVPLIIHTSPDDRKMSWEAYATEYTSHTADEWIRFFEVAIIPEYMRRHNLATEEALEDHAKEWVAKDDERKSRRVVERNTVPIAQSTVHGDEGEEEEEMEQEEQEEQEEIEESVKTITTTAVETSLFIESESPKPFIALQDLKSTAGDQHVRSREETPIIVLQTDTNPKSPTREPSPVTHVKKTTTANEGRKRAIQGTTSQSTQSTQPSLPSSLQQKSEESRAKPILHKAATISGSELSQMAEQEASQMPAPSQKRRLFGRVLGSTQEVVSNQMQQTNVDSLAFTASQFVSQEPPESGQRPLRSTDLSESTQTTSTNSEQQKELPETVPETIQSALHDSHTHEETETDASVRRGQGLDLLDGGPLSGENNDQANSIRAASEAESEYVPLDGGPERSQMWVSSVDTDSDDDIDGDEEEIEVQAIVPSAIRNDGDESESEQEDDEGISAEPQSEALEPPLTTSNRRSQTTQALWQQSLKETQPAFGVPEPEDGWSDDEELLNSQLREEDSKIELELVLETTEHADEPNGVDLLQVKTERRQEDIGSDSPEQVGGRIDAAISSENRVPDAIRYETISSTSPSRSPPQPAQPLAIVTKSTAEAELGADTSTYLPSAEQEETIGEWLMTMKALYNTVSGSIVNVLSYVSLRACSGNFVAAELVLQQLMTAHIAYETRRRNAMAAHGSKLLDKYRPLAQMSLPHAQTRIPNDLRGVWTVADDDDLLSRDVARIRRVESKHGERGSRRRIAFLEEIYGKE